MPTDPNAETGEQPLIPPPPLSSQVKVDLGAVSHPGRVRPNNEDCYLVATFDRSLQMLLTNLPAGSIPGRVQEVGYGMLVADGIGGMAAGEVASRLAASTLIDIALATSDWIMRLDGDGLERVMRRFAEYYRAVDAALRAKARTDPRLYGMGTTMTLMSSLGADLVLAHVGDSRAYLFRAGRLRQITRDHTVAQAMADAGEIRPEEVRTHRQRHVLTRALGETAEPVDADIDHLRLLDGDQILLCTDGLTEMVEDTAIAAVLGAAATAQKACEALLEAALRGGGKDNVTLTLARYRFAREP
jgi:protein phosphatase